ncbi:MAG: acyl-CoA dehydrogenase family protein [Candidatus Hydrogenedentes bacterium]|nr:acyl-CoA dehydrogenase family protein [Candidatus Hydrogenedentota bacterium]
MAHDHSGNVAKDKTMELAEESRETEWKFPSFTAEIFQGKFRWELLHPYPVQSDEDRKIGDDFIAKLKDVCEKHIDAEEIDQTGEYPQAALDALAEIGTFGMTIAKEYGGLGFSKTNYCRALHFLGSYCSNTVTWVSAHQSIGAPQPLKLFGTKEQKEKYLPLMAKGAISAFALTEHDVGSDPGKMSMTATLTEDGEHYILNGEKLWITNGPAASILVVMTNIPGKIVRGKEKMQITTFIVEKDMPGFTVLHHCSFMGIKGIANGVLKFDNVKVPKENMVGKPGEGLKIALTTLNTGRLGLPASSTGGAKLMLKELEKWINDRVQWGVPIGKHQAIAKYSANMAADIFAMDSIVWLTTNWADKGNADIRLEAAAAKYFCTETSWRLTDDFVQVRGGRGYETSQSLFDRGDRPVPAERWLRDARIGRIFEGSTQVMYLIMGREAMDVHFKLAMPLMKPDPRDKRSFFEKLMTAAKFYVKWYPGLYFPSSQSYNVKHLNPSNQSHLPYIERTGRKLARSLFHTMGKYREKLEFEQVILANYVDIGVDLFVMGAVLAMAEAKLAQNPSDHTPQELADLFCKNARQRIANNFRAVKHNHNSTFDSVTDTLMKGEFEWMYNDIYTDVVPRWRKAESPAPVAEPVAVEQPEEEAVPAPK